MKKSIILILLVMVAFSCSQNRQEKDQVKIQNTTLIRGRLEDGRNHSLFVQNISSDRFITIDTLKIDSDDSFSVRIKVDYPGFYSVTNEDGKGITFTAYGNDTVNIDGKYYNFRDFILDGSHDLRQITLLNQKTQEFLRKIDTFAAITNDSIRSPDYTHIKMGIDREYKSAFGELRDYSLDFIRRNKGSLVTLLALSNQLGPRFYVFHPVNDMDLFLRTDSVLYGQYPDNEPVKALHTQMITIRNQYAATENINSNFAVGQRPPEIDLPSPEGKKIALSSMRGKIVLVDFWASWCPPCRQENPNLVETYRKFHPKGFEIYQVSLDKDRENWVSAIRNDHLDWIHVSDLKYWNSMVVPLYNISSIPSNYLLDRDGKIIDSNLRGEQLSQKLNEIFN